MQKRPVVPALIGLAALSACGASPGDVEEIKKGQKDILAKLDGVEKAVQKVQAAAPAPQRPQADPNKVYDIPIGSSPVKGPKAAKVSIVEFSDFQ